MLAALFAASMRPSKLGDCDTEDTLGVSLGGTELIADEDLSKREGEDARTKRRSEELLLVRGTRYEISRSPLGEFSPLGRSFWL